MVTSLLHHVGSHLTSAAVCLLPWQLNLGSIHGNLVKPMPRKKNPERRSGLCPFEKELPERRPGAFRHKNTDIVFVKRWFITVLTANVNVSRVLLRLV
jgi:hypothetical protein